MCWLRLLLQQRFLAHVSRCIICVITEIATIWHQQNKATMRLRHKRVQNTHTNMCDWVEGAVTSRHIKSSKSKAFECTHTHTHTSLPILVYCRALMLVEFSPLMYKSTRITLLVIRWSGFLVFRSTWNITEHITVINTQANTSTYVPI